MYVRCLNYGRQLFNIREQQDEFFTNLTDLVDEYLKVCLGGMGVRGVVVVYVGVFNLWRKP